MSLAYPESRHQTKTFQEGNKDQTPARRRQGASGGEGPSYPDCDHSFTHKTCQNFPRANVCTLPTVNYASMRLFIFLKENSPRQRSKTGTTIKLLLQPSLQNKTRWVPTQQRAPQTAWGSAPRSWAAGTGRGHTCTMLGAQLRTNCR